MNPTQRLLLRQAILLQLAAAAPASLLPATLLHGAALAGFRIDEQGLQVELAYLAGKNLAQITPSSLSQGLARAQLTAAGRDYLEAEHLA
jgi:hypothetical protein